MIFCWVGASNVYPESIWKKWLLNVLTGGRKWNRKLTLPTYNKKVSCNWKEERGGQQCEVRTNLYAASFLQHTKQLQWLTTRYRYSKITRKSGNIRGRILCLIVVRYSSVRVFEFTYTTWSKYTTHINNRILQFKIKLFFFLLKKGPFTINIHVIKLVFGQILIRLEIEICVAMILVPNTQLRYQWFGNPLNDEPQIGTPIRRSLLTSWMEFALSLEKVKQLLWPL